MRVLCELYYMCKWVLHATLHQLNVNGAIGLYQPHRLEINMVLHHLDLLLK